MKKKLTLLLISLLLNQFAWSQTESFCLTSQGKIKTSPPAASSRIMGAYDCPLYVVNVYFHFVRSTTNPGFTDSDIPTILNNLNSVYNTYGISFISAGSRSWTDDFWGSPTTPPMPFTGIFAASGANPQPNAINLYMLPPNNSVQGGFAPSVPSTALFVGGTRPVTFNCQTINYVLPLTRIVAHEVGHCLGLSHPFTGASGNGDGDGLSDTTPDYMTENSCVNPATCQFEGMLPNNCNSCTQATNPTTIMTNVMSYTVPTCMSAFSPMQMAIVRGNLANNYQGIVNNVNLSACPCSAAPNLQSMTYTRDGYSTIVPASTVNRVASNAWYTVKTMLDPTKLTGSVTWNTLPHTPTSPFNGFAQGSQNIEFRFNLSAGQTFEFKNITATNDCGTSQRWMVFDSNGPYSLVVYPNAAQETVTVQFDKGTGEDTLPEQINLLDQLSKPVRSVKVKGNERTLIKDNKLEIDVKDLPRGIYYLQTIDVSKKIDIKRIILN